MSREHGKLFIASKGEVHIQDSASTHGTWIGPRRLASDESSALSHGDIITFGTTVTSGPVTYHARSFDVRISWTYSQQVSPSSMSSIISEHSGFRVPHEDVESISDESDPGSCQILRSHPRTFSVPSSGDEEEDSDSDDDIVIPSSRRSFLASANALNSQTPHSVLSNSHTKTGAHEGITMIDKALDDDSEDERPDDIPSGQGQQQLPGGRGVSAEDTADASMSITEIPDTFQSLDSHAFETQACPAGNNGYDRRGTEEPGFLQESEFHSGHKRDTSSVDSNRFTVESSIEGPVSFHIPVSASNSRQSILSPSKPHLEHEYGMSWQPVDTHEHVDNGYKRDGHSYIGNSISCPRSLSSTDEPKGKDSQIIKEPSAQARSGQGETSENARERDNGADASQHLYQKASLTSTKGDVTKGLSQVRPVSSNLPSDSTTPFDYSPSQATGYLSPYFHVSKESHSQPGLLETPSALHCPYPQHAAPILQESALTRARAPSPSDAALARKADLGRAENNNPPNAAVDNDTVRGSNRRKENELHQDPFAGSNYSLPPAKFFGDLRSDPSMSKHRSSLASLLAQASDDWQIGQASNLDTRRLNELDVQRPGNLNTEGSYNFDSQRTKPGEYKQGPFSRSFESFHSAAEPSHTDSRSTSPPPPKQCLVKLKFDHKTTDKHSHDPSSERLVYPDHQNSEHVKSSKVDISNLVNSHAEASRGKKRKLDVLSSGEPSSMTSSIRSPTLSTSMASPQKTIPGTEACNAASDEDETLSQELLHYLSQPDTDTVEEGPARKKSKPTMSRASTISKFVSGVCLGVVGAFAAFVAAAPADVWDEALREAVKL
ncbi:MAG: hypothetical protein Q9225_001484 [Loekoesia sp. 1 TL-2023]